MRVKTSLTFDETTLPIIRARAEADGLELSRWVERAALYASAEADLDILDAWDASLVGDDRAVSDALAALDKAGLPE